ncbi:MAG: RagB/SusD family nutrient uptake outer membrane protein [Bacteroidales bacterium]
MKKYIIYSMIFASMIISTGCNLLDREPIAFPTESNFYTDQGGLEGGVIGIYDAFQSSNMYGGNFISTMERRSDNVKNNNSGGGGGLEYAISHFTETPESSVILNGWRGLYVAILRANLVLLSVENVKLSPDIALKIKGQAAFLRALSYFHLVRMYGPVPLILKPQLPEEARHNKLTPVENIYNQIISDLEIAQSLPPKWEQGRVTSYAATALLAKVYLYRKDWDKVESLLTPLVTEITGTKSNIALVSPAATFPNGLKTSKDVIFAIQYLKGGVGESVHQNNRYRNQDGGNDILIPQSIFEQGDTRKNLLAPPSSGSRPEKFNMPAVSNETDGDMPVLRAAEVMLMYAEAINEKISDGAMPPNKAFDAINAVRVNAGIENAILTNETTPTKEAFRSALYKERRIELALECDRWFDIVRTGQFEVVNPGVDPEKKLYAYPQRELEILNDPASWVR